MYYTKKNTFLKYNKIPVFENNILKKGAYNLKKILIVLAVLVVAGAMFLYIKSNTARIPKNAGGTFVQFHNYMKGAQT